MKPDCFTNYDPMPRAVCGSCAYRGQCASKTELPVGLGILPYARFPKRKDVLETLPGVSASLDHLNDKLAQTGLCVEGKTVYNVARRRICKVTVHGPVFVCETVFHRDEVAVHPDIVGCEVRHRVLKHVATDSRKTIKIRQEGSLVLCASVESACRAINAIAVLKRVARDRTRARR